MTTKINRQSYLSVAQLASFTMAVAMCAYDSGPGEVMLLCVSVFCQILHVVEVCCTGQNDASRND
jgi:hypothetical protein